ncbi:hypothetical protein PPTG_21172 [Phytophthora nicotianae INRA-310]|uniref:Uncharacterized protein n=1 Tax=Phytophthora nicotianae (strain INRA-310) TaxID=761204 RepID=W2RB90_PHYN3|nr:hypothetical protein PPTG_21172 [Phytophthora nicotianae INRA-310]ETN21964.1 hypothetical protein PPTG_21172 [Phytophthora nicotianae INRA-310]
MRIQHEVSLFGSVAFGGEIICWFSRKLEYEGELRLATCSGCPQPVILAAAKKCGERRL